MDMLTHMRPSVSVHRIPHSWPQLQVQVSSACMGMMGMCVQNHIFLCVGECIQVLVRGHVDMLECVSVHSSLFACRPTGKTFR